MTANWPKQRSSNEGRVSTNGYRVVVDGDAWRGELGAHRHEEAVENVQRGLAFHLNQPAVETAAEFDEFLRLFATKEISQSKHRSNSIRKAMQRPITSYQLRVEDNNR
jgi:hypothetical protein